ncbi:hypothetical protein [Micromonospora sp. NPDC007230]
MITKLNLLPDTADADVPDLVVTRWHGGRGALPKHSSLWQHWSPT